MAAENRKYNNVFKTLNRMSRSPDPMRRGGKVSLLTITFELLKRDSAGTGSLLFRQELPLPPQQQAMIKSKLERDCANDQLTSKEALCSWDRVSRCAPEVMYPVRYVSFVDVTLH